ncbi:MAG: hypothetical protein Q4B55_07405, partial [Lachnospiraceae bacterium]|nr:hypothetical protein [Lachnospiraceae bacterium]
SLQEDPYGTSLLPEGKVLMELKCAGGYPMWMVKFLSENRIFKTSFSKYGTAYQTMIWPEKQKNLQAVRRQESVRSRRMPARARVAVLQHA